MEQNQYESALAKLGLTLPVPRTPVANYVPYVQSGALVTISGQIPFENGSPAYVGKLGREFNVEQGEAAARLCALGIIALVREACGGDLDRVVRCVRVGGFVNCTPDFGEQPQVINGASDLLVAVFGDRGRHARAAVGVASLPRGVAVEVEATFEVRTG